MSTWRAGLRAAFLAAALSLAQGESAASQVVSGQVTILERAGARTTDLASAVVFLEPASPHAAPPVPSPSSTPIAMESREFIPRVRVVTVGSSVAFPNQDPFRHNVFSNTGPATFDLGLYGRGESKSVSLRAPGVFPVFCNIHARMVAFVVAVSTPYFTQVGADGRFTVPNVRAGTYRLRVWHERGGEQSRSIEVPDAGARDVNVQLDARGFRDTQHKNKFGQEYTPTGRDRY